MRPARFALYSLLPLFAACQVWKPAPVDTHAQTRVQGELTRQGNDMMFRPCQEQRHFLLVDGPNGSVARESRDLFADGAAKLFVDVRGGYSGGQSSNTDGKLEVDTLYRIQGEGRGCEDPNFKHTIVQAIGNEPAWNVMINAQGLLLQRPGKPALVVPYVVESVPGGSSSYSSEANGEKLELWVAPTRCVNSMTGAVTQMSAELRLDNQVMRGCAYPGGAYAE
ncbi:COG3650 family protein [Pseudomonas knackmussii]|uniref:COG3650 family protein n=1 Tax=Pseudomonas knackmussii TaxID=65741 RepID=UPI0013633B4C|nr:hypothetical protein [Pseudomonas knackmussii]